MNLNELLPNGPARVVIEPGGEATTPKIAREEYGVFPDIIFIRDDGWALAAPSDLEDVAYRMWRDEWKWFARRGSMDARPMSEYCLKEEQGA